MKESNPSEEFEKSEEVFQYMVEQKLKEKENERPATDDSSSK